MNQYCAIRTVVKNFLQLNRTRIPLKKSPYRNHFLRKWGITAVKRHFLHPCSQNAAFFVQKWGIRAEKFLEQRVFQSSLRAIFLLSSILWKIFHSPR